MCFDRYVLDYADAVQRVAAARKPVVCNGKHLGATLTIRCTTARPPASVTVRGPTGESKESCDEAVEQNWRQKLGELIAELPYVHDDERPVVSFEAGDDSVALSLSAYRAFTRDYIVQANYTETSVKVVGARDSAVSQVSTELGMELAFPSSIHTCSNGRSRQSPHDSQVVGRQLRRSDAANNNNGMNLRKRA